MRRLGTPRLPALHKGDRLTRDEFKRRYEAEPPVNKAERVGGIVYKGVLPKNRSMCYESL